MIRRHKRIEFSEQLDQYSHIDNSKLYDSAVKFMDESNYGFDLLFSEEWSNYLKRLVFFRL